MRGDHEYYFTLQTKLTIINTRIDGVKRTLKYVGLSQESRDKYDSMMVSLRAERELIRESLRIMEL